MTPQLAGIAASMFGLMNLFARSLGGLLSDYCNTRWGMRGRLWSCWIIQTCEGIMCLVLGSLTTSLDAPYPTTMTQVPAFVNLPAESWRVAIGAPYGWTPLNGNGCVSSETVLPCGSKQIKATAELKSCLQTQDTLILVQDPPYGTMLIDGVNTTIGTSNADTGLPNECISHANLFSVAVIIVIIFSVFVQMTFYTLASCPTSPAPRSASFPAWWALEATSAPSLRPTSSSRVPSGRTWAWSTLAA